MPINRVFLIYPGDINTPTGGYHYDRRLIQEWLRAGVAVEPIALSAEFPKPSPEALAEAALCVAQ